MRLSLPFFLTLACNSNVKTAVVETEDTVVISDLDADGYDSDSDSDDNDSSVNPGMDEICDGIDNNCNGAVDEDVLQTFYIDSDDDGFGNSEETIQACDQETGFVPNANDCDDSNADIHPGVTEDCNSIDDNCDGEIDEDIGEIYYLDADGDGYGDPDETVLSCELVDGLVENSDDCNDHNEDIHPDALEICDEIDNDCDDTIDDDAVTGMNTYYTDSDEDGFGDENAPILSCSIPAQASENSDDCDDLDPLIHPDTSWYLDADSDGYGNAAISTTACLQPTGYVADSSDCNDLAFDVNTAAIEICDEIDNDCDGDIDDDDSSILSSSFMTYYNDSDGDGYGDGSTSQEQCSQPNGFVTNSNDCNDSDITINPNTSWFVDQDGDGYGLNSSPIQSCNAPLGYAQQASDCDDSNADIHPDTDWYFDADGDGYGAGNPTTQCAQPAGDYVLNVDDCSPLQATAWSGAPELCDGIDNDCNGSTDEGALLSWYLDYDGDGYGDTATLLEACSPPTSFYVGDDGDCDDTDTDFNPGQAEGCDDRDLNCDGNIDNDADGDGYSDYVCGGLDCNDDDPLQYPEQGGGCPLGDTCLDILEQNPFAPSDTYLIDPDGNGFGEAPFEVYCDMITDDGGWTQVTYSQANDPSGYNTDYADVFSNIIRNSVGSSSYKVDASQLLLLASEFRYSDQLNDPSDSRFDYWNADIACTLTSDALNNIQNPGYLDQVSAAVTCRDLHTDTISTSAIYMNYEGWNGCWGTPRLWVGYNPAYGGYTHGDYVTHGVATWRCNSSPFSGSYYGPSGTNYASVAFWLR